jgi:hypothetical protein
MRASFSDLTNYEFRKYGASIRTNGEWTMRTDFETRALIVLQEEAARSAAAAERVRLVVQAITQRRGVVRPEPVRDAGYDFGA